MESPFREVLAIQPQASRRRRSPGLRRLIIAMPLPAYALLIAFALGLVVGVVYLLAVREELDA